ncbi:hypothetical protein [Burkholderia sp. Tr-20390]|uniref:hypothetical protein n=1 Tax=Burkholderia sp. Tr-20390 TaxID=2703904 RepID=UPI001980F42E|nr:hypothetical protein [Burkholderia sp. Tr-20390]MBN3729511.1 hypothetical protein [Burkholderia sp. Tr-20390]
MKPQDFPTLLSTLKTPRAIARLEESLRHLSVGLEVGQIPNTHWTEAKQNINGILGDAFSEHVRSTVFGQIKSIEDLPEPVQDLYWATAPQLHTIGSWTKRMAKFKFDHPLATCIRQFLQEVKPLGDAAEQLKSAVVKRAPKPAEEQKPRYTPPRASTGAIVKVREALEAITKNSYDKLREGFFSRYKAYVDQYMASEGASDSPTRPYDFFVRRKEPNSEAFHIASKCLEAMPYGSKSGQPRLLPNHEAILHDIAEREATDIRDKFVYKNLSKLASIVDAKDNLASVDVLGYEIQLTSLRGSLRLAFEDGSCFDVQNSVVWSRSVHDKVFLRFPLTFHQVVMPDGSKMKLPSEEKMNTEFAGRYYGFVRAPESEKLLLESLGLRLAPFDHARGAFMAAATHAALTRLAELHHDFEADLKLRAFKPIDEMTVPELDAELRWHDWTAAIGATTPEASAERAAVQAALDELKRKQAIDQAFAGNAKDNSEPRPGE